MHVHVAHPDGEAKLWLTPEIEVAVAVGMSQHQLSGAEDTVQRYEEEIRHASTRNFGG